MNAGGFEMRHVLPFGDGEELPWGAVRIVEVRSPRALRLMKMMLPTREADRLLVEQITVDDDALLEREDGDSPLPGNLFDYRAYGVDLRAPVGMLFRISFRAVPKPSSPQSFTVAWWRRWFTREGWRGARPPRVSGALMLVDVGGDS